MKRHHAADQQLAQALLEREDPERLVDLARSCEDAGLEWSGWVIEQLSMSQDEWREQALDALEPLVANCARPLTPNQAHVLLDHALARPGDPDLRVMGLLKRLGHGAGCEVRHGLECARQLAQGCWFPPGVVVDGLFHRAGDGLYQSEFFKDLMRPADRTRQVDVLHLMRIDRSGMFGPAEFTQPLASAVLGARTRDFLHWDDFNETGNFEAALVWMIEREWVRADLVRQAIEADTARVPNPDVEDPLLEMMVREQARVLDGKMRRETAHPAGGNSPVGSRRL